MNLSKSKHHLVMTITKFWCLILVFSIISTQSISQVKSLKLNKKPIDKRMVVATRNDKLVIYQIVQDMQNYPMIKFLQNQLR